MRILLLAFSGVVALGAALLAGSPQDGPPAVSERFGQQPVPMPYVVKDITPSQPVAQPHEHLTTVPFVRFRGQTYFLESGNPSGIGTGRGFWRTDGTESGTVLVHADVGPGTELKNVRDRLLYFVSFGEGGLWASDGTAAGTRLVTGSDSGGVPQLGSMITFSMDASGDELFFPAETDEEGQELWATRGTPETTRLIADIQPGPESSTPTNLTAFRGELYFGADTSPDGFLSPRELFKTDGTREGTVPVATRSPRLVLAIPGEVVPLGDYLIFAAGEQSYNTELWRTDGTDAGTIQLADIIPGPDGSNPANLARVGREIYFSAASADGNGGYRGGLWKTDGTPEGTALVSNACSVPQGVPFRGAYLFACNDPVHQREVWFSDGTPEGTRLVKDVTPAHRPASGNELTGPRDFAVFGSEAWFVTNRPAEVRGTERTELWRTDGTEAGTQLVWEAPGRINGYLIHGLTRSGRHLFFSASTAVNEIGHGIEQRLYAVRLHPWFDFWR